MKKIKFFAMAMAAMMSLGMVSCNKDKNLDYTGETLTNGGVITVKEKVDNASYETRFTLTLRGTDLVVTGLNDTARVQGYSDYPNCNTGVGIMDYGKVNALSKIDEYPGDSDFKDAEGHFVTTLPAAEKHGYVIKTWGDGKLDLFQNPDLKDPRAAYSRIWLEEADGDGFKVRYEFDYTIDD